MKDFKSLPRLNEAVTQDPPAILILKRKYIRMFPGNVKVAIYHSDKLNKYVTIPYEQIQFEDVNEPIAEATKPKKPFSFNHLAALKNIIVTGKPETLKYANGSECEVDTQEANEILSIYARCSPENQKKMVEMLGKGAGGVMKLMKFCKQNQE